MLSTLRLIAAVCVLFTGAEIRAATQASDARAISVTGQVFRIRDGQPWAVSAGDRIPIQQTITTGSDGFAKFQVAGGSSFDIFSNSRVVFRQNAANPGDLLDVIAGRVRVHLQPNPAAMQQRIFCPVAVITARERSTVALAIDEDDAARIDVMEGAIRVQHALLPRGEPILISAVDAILIDRDERISRRLDRGSLYRFTVQPLKEVFSALTLGHPGGRSSQTQFGSDRLLARVSSSPFAPASAR